MAHGPHIDLPVHFDTPAKVDRPPSLDRPPLWENQDDAFMALLMASVDSIDKEIAIQGANAQVVEAWALGASLAVDQGNQALTNAATAMGSLTGEDLTKAMANYQALQTQVANTNQNYTNNTQAGSTEITNLTQALSQLVSFANVANDNKDSTNNLIATWGGA